MPRRIPNGIRPRHAWSLAAVCLLALTGCSTFDRDWRASACYATTAGGLDGLWEGTWHSDFNGHQGKLRAIIVRQSDDQYLAHFRAKYLLVLPFEFSIPLHVTEDGGVHVFQGQADLGWLAGGVYQYHGQADAWCFQANYCAKKDYGTFTMTRLPPCVQYQCPCSAQPPPAADYE